MNKLAQTLKSNRFYTLTDEQIKNAKDNAVKVGGTIAFYVVVHYGTKLAIETIDGFTGQTETNEDITAE